MNVSVGGKTGRLIREQAERISRCRLTFHLIGSKNAQALVNQNIVDRALFLQDAGEGGGAPGAPEPGNREVVGRVLRAVKAPSGAD